VLRQTLRDIERSVAKVAAEVGERGFSAPPDMAPTLPGLGMSAGLSARPRTTILLS
jgi:hypothetical protein